MPGSRALSGTAAGRTWISIPSRSSRAFTCRCCSSTATTMSGSPSNGAWPHGDARPRVPQTMTSRSCGWPGHDMRRPCTVVRTVRRSLRSTSERSSPGSMSACCVERRAFLNSNAMSEATWRRRFRATTVMFPTWSRERPERLLYLSNAGGKFEVYAWDQRTGERRQVTDRAEGTGYRVSSRLDPRGDWIWWFDDEKGNELGRWVREPWEGGPRETIAPQLAPAYSGRIAIHSGGPAIGRGFAVIARSRSDEGTSVYVVADDQAPRSIYAHEQSAFIDGLSRDGALVALFHSEHGDSRNRVLRIIDTDGTRVAELSHGAGHGLSPSGGWSPVAGDARFLAVHDREDLERPLIFDAKAGTSREIKLDLPGETFADWYSDAASLLIGHDHRGRTELYRYDLASSALERLATEPGTISTARVRPDGEVWYMLDRSSAPAAIRKVGGGVVLAGGDAPRGF